MNNEKSSSSLKINMVLNAVNGFMNVIFPLITFPYISKTLGVTEIGKVNFTNSFISYFILLAGLGINAYAIREGARIRNKSEEINKFASQVFTINILSAVSSYILLFIIVNIFDTLDSYKKSIYIYSIIILSTTIGADWIFTIYEDFLWTTIRKFVVKIVSLVLMFLFIKEPSDTIKYILIMVLADSGGYLVNIFFIPKYCKIKLTFKINFKEHIKPILILFATAVSVTIFVNLDITLLGILCSDEDVGIYSVSSKIYIIIKTILSSVIVAAIPRLSSALDDTDNAKFEEIVNDVFKTLVTVLIPAVIGIISLRKEIILIVSNETFSKADSSLYILGISLIASLFSWFWGQCVLVPLRKEKIVLVSNIVSAVVNIVLNITLMPVFDGNAAAFSTLVSEIICYIWARVIARKYIKLKNIPRFTIKILIGCVVEIIVICGLKLLVGNFLIYTVLSISFSIILYFIVEKILKNESLGNLGNKIFNKI